MATRSTIAIQNVDGSVTGIYCHWDGGFWWNGKVLRDEYTTEEKVRELISLGHLSSLGKDIHPNPDEPHSFDKSQKDVCVFYRRDRGEKEQNCETFHNWLALIRNQGQEYDYLFVPGEGWKVNCYNGVYDLAEAMEKENA
jgi:hypothetical protein